LAIYDWVKADQGDIDDVAVIGRSLGSGVAVQLAAARPVSRLVLVTPFASIVQLGRELMPWLPVSLLARDRYESIRVAPQITAPTLVLIADDDHDVPPHHATRLASGFRAGTARTIIVPGRGHNDIQEWPAYHDEIGRFVVDPNSQLTTQN
jgi:pimeloyl-ACP methyl ester carboxylesterase